MITTFVVSAGSGTLPKKKINSPLVRYPGTYTSDKSSRLPKLHPMAAVTTKKRKRDVTSENNAVKHKKSAVDHSISDAAKPVTGNKSRSLSGPRHDGLIGRDANFGSGSPSETGSISVQIVTGSYDRVLHGFSASIARSRLDRAISPTITSQETTSPEEIDPISFSDAFLLAGHSSSIRCLAISPQTENDKRILATGSSDERINVYSISTAPPQIGHAKSIPTLAGTSVVENRRNRSLGSLIHHDRAITSLQFATKSKLFSAAEDNTIAISRTRDWTMLSSIKAPIPKPQGRPSGDTAAPGETPAGVNDFSIHPSQKLMLSVGRGERCMRLWNLMTGKKAGVLNFDRDLLTQVGEGKHSSGEGRTVLWNESGEAYVVGFERGAVLYGIDSKPKGIIRPSPPTKFHKMRFIPQSQTTGRNILAISTEDGRVLFFDTIDDEEITDLKSLPSYNCIAQLGGRAAGFTGRVKDFELVEIPHGELPSLVLITASSDGAIRLWRLLRNDFTPETLHSNGDDTRAPKQIGDLLGTRETGNRITCLGAFVLDGQVSSEKANGDDVITHERQSEDGIDDEDSE
nr:p21-activated protein kinase-interacting protein 1 [Quercus suber]